MTRRRGRRRDGWPKPKPTAGDRGRSVLCSHNKQLYPSRAAAVEGERQVRGRDPSGAGSIRPYRCSDVEGSWHLGHLAAAVVAGEVDEQTFYSGQAPARCYAPREEAPDARAR